MIISFIIIYFLQSNFFSWFTIWEVKPNLYVLFVLVIGLFAGRRIGVAIGIISGLILDFTSGLSVGPTAIILGIIGFFGGYLEKNFSKDSRITLIIMAIIVTITYEVFKYVVNILINSINVEILPFVKILLIECIYNCLLLIIMYPIIKKAGYAIDETFRSRQMLTRYF